MMPMKPISGEVNGNSIGCFPGTLFLSSLIHLSKSRGFSLRRDTVHRHRHRDKNKPGSLVVLAQACNPSRGRWISELKANLVYTVSYRITRAPQSDPATEKKSQKQFLGRLYNGITSAGHFRFSLFWGLFACLFKAGF